MPGSSSGEKNLQRIRNSRTLIKNSRSDRLRIVAEASRIAFSRLSGPPGSRMAVQSWAGERGAFGRAITPLGE